MESIIVAQGSKEEQYKSLIPQIASLIADESDLYANLANVVAALKEVFDHFWVGFYLVKEGRLGGEELVLGPFQGPVACTRIGFGKGVCGGAWERKSTLVVPNVDEFPGHIACSSLSRSEIVVPFLNKEGKVMAVLDIDSRELSAFDQVDAHYLERLFSPDFW